MNETLEHHGILGMKWGVRRYQNKDGTWTEEGKEHRNPSIKDCKKEYNELRKQRNAYYDKYGMDLPEKESKELDSIDEKINSLIEGRYSEAVFREYNEKQPELIRNHTGEEVSWKDAFGDSYENTTKGNRHSLVGLVEGGTGQYRFKSRTLGHSDESEDDIASDDSTEDSLMHYGVKGQSWGKRNYQFEDGTLTEEGKERYSTNSGGVRGRRRTTNTVQGEAVHKTESVNQGKAPQMTQQVTQSTTTHAHDLLTEKKNNKMSDEDYAKAKQEFAKRDFVQVYDGAAGKMLYVKKDEFRDHIRKLASQGIDVKMPYLDSSDKSDDSMSDIRMKNAEIRFWNELVEKAQSQTYTGPESEDLFTKDDEKAKRKEIADRKAAIKAKVEEHRKKNPALIQSDEDEDSLMHYGILGMKWGIRRFQNKDGSLTAAGRKRYGDDIPDGNKSSDNSSDATPRTPAKSASEMSDQELQSALNRLRMEQQYNELTGAKSSNQYQNQQNFQSPPSNTNALSNAELQAYITRLDMEKRYAQLTAPPPKEVSAGQKFIKEVVGPAVNQVAKAFIVSALSKALGLSGDGGNNSNNNNNGGGKNKNNDGGQQKNYDKRFNETNSRIDKLANAVNNLANKSKQDANIVPAKSKNDRNSDDGADNNAMTPASNQSTSNTPHRDSIFAIARNTVRNAQDRWRANESEREQKRQESREQREKRNASWSAFLTGLERQTGGGVNPVTKSYETKAQSYFNSYLYDMSKKKYGK